MLAFVAVRWISAISPVKCRSAPSAVASHLRIVAHVQRVAVIVLAQNGRDRPFGDAKRSGAPRKFDNKPKFDKGGRNDR